MVTKIKDTQLEDWSEIFLAVTKENNRQIKKWGIQDKHIFDWFMWFAEEFGEFAQAINEMVYRNGPVENVVTEGIQVITLAMKIVDGVLKAIE